MKTALSIFCLAFLYSCKSNNADTFYTTVMIDLSEQDGNRPSAKIIKNHAVLPERESGMYFSILPINDLAHNTHKGVMITKANTGINYDEMSRKLLVDDYNQKVDQLLTSLDSLKYGTEHSQIFRAILTEARFLMKQKCDVRTIICYSDLEENSPLFSIHNKEHRKLMDTSQVLQSYFEQQYNLGENESFKGLTIEIHHIPSFEHEQNFDAFLKLYKDIFESRGAKISHELSTITQVEL